MSCLLSVTYFFLHIIWTLLVFELRGASRGNTHTHTHNEIIGHVGDLSKREREREKKNKKRGTAILDYLTIAISWCVITSFCAIFICFCAIFYFTPLPPKPRSFVFFLLRLGMTQKKIHVISCVSSCCWQYNNPVFKKSCINLFLLSRNFVIVVK